jgi:DNA-directed RNA polymerase subunit K/omega
MTTEEKSGNTGDLDLDVHSKYELVMIAAREARRLNERARASGKELKRRVTEVAWERLEHGDIHFTYGELPYEDEPLPPPPMIPIPDEDMDAALEAADNGDSTESDSEGETEKVEEGA